MVSVDGTDFRIYEPTPFSKQWYSFKFRAAGVRWEVGVSIFTGDIVWINGWFPCGAWPDIKIFRNDLLAKLLETNEMVEADRGYRGEPDAINVPDGDNAPVDEKDQVRGRHETVNKRFKQFNILHRVFRHEREQHAFVFPAVAVLTQLSIENESPLFQVEYTAN